MLLGARAVQGAGAAAVTPLSLTTGLRLLPWAAAPSMIAPTAGALSDRIGPRPLMVTGMLLQAGGLGWVALEATGSVSDGALVAPLIVAGVGISMALPTTPAAALGAVMPADLGPESGTNNTLQRFGGVFGVAVATAVFAAHGHFGTPAAFDLGFRPALAFAAGLSLLASLAALLVTAHRGAAAFNRAGPRAGDEQLTRRQQGGSMRVLFTTQPASGHLHPLVPLARALDDAGHAVAVCSAPSFRSEVEAFGLVHIDAGLDWLASDRSTWGALPPLPPPGPEFIKFGVATWADVTARAMIPDLLAIAREWKADLIVREGMEYGGCVAAECLGIPHASVAINTCAALDSPDVHHIAGNRLLVGAALSRHREEHGLPPDPGVQMPFRHLHLCFTPPRWDAEGAPRPANTRFVRHTSAEWPGAPSLDWLGGLPDRPTVLASLGTGFNKTPGVLEAIIEGLGGEPVTVIVAIGPGQDPSRFGRPPANVRLEAYVSQARLLAHCDLFITHGGFNSVKQALSEGVPMVVVPISADQPYSAERCVALGVAEAIDPGARSPNAIRAVARKVLGDASYRASARRFQSEMAALPDSKEVVKLLQALGGRTVAKSVPASATRQQRPRRLVAPRSARNAVNSSSDVHQPHGDQPTEASRR